MLIFLRRCLSLDDAKEFLLVTSSIKQVFARSPDLWQRDMGGELGQGARLRLMHGEQNSVVRVGHGTFCDP
jgi:hypothetical protein